MVGDVIYQLF